MSRFPFLTALAATLGIVTSSAHAQFSNVDPVQAVHAVQQINQGVQLYSTTREQLQNVIDNYNLAKQMASSPSMLFSTFQSRSQQWVGVSPSANTYGNTAGWIPRSATTPRYAEQSDVTVPLHPSFRGPLPRGGMS